MVPEAQPQEETVPLALSAWLWGLQPDTLPAIATTLVNPGGILVSAESEPPHKITLPSPVNARLWKPPAATAMMLVSPRGIFVWP